MTALPPESGVAAFFAFMNERHRIYLRRAAGEPEPWTDDPYLRRPHRYCNVDRELDRVTIWIRTRWREPYADHPSLWFAMAVARAINNTAVLEELGYPEVWSAERTLQVLLDLKARGVPIWTPSYRRCIPHEAGGSRERYCVEILDGLWRDPPPLESARTLEDAFCMLQGRRGLGRLLSYEIVTDLRHTRYLRDAPDIMTWANAGPGAVKGLHHIWRRLVGQRLRPD